MSVEVYVEICKCVCVNMYECMIVLLFTKVYVNYWMSLIT